MAGAGQAEGPLVCVWIRGERGSPGSFGDVTVPDSHQSQSVTQESHAPSPGGSNQK